MSECSCGEDPISSLTGSEVSVPKQFHNGNAMGVLIGTDVHILKRSSSSYSLYINGARYQYCCQDGCCDKGLRSDVDDVVRQAKAEGATRVVIRTGQNSYYVRRIQDLPVSDVTNHIGFPEPNYEVARRWT